MDELDGFKAPSALPQDLLLIQELIGLPPTLPKIPVSAPEDDIDSSSDESSSDGSIDSEEEVVEGLLSKVVDDDSANTDTGSDSESSSSDSESGDEKKTNDGPDHAKKLATDADAEDDDDDGGPKVQGYFTTPHEVTDVKITIPEISEVSAEEALDKVGEVMTVLSDTVVVKGMPAPIIGRASEKALDSETLLVLEDRRVLGYIYETFGPTYQPLYQVKFNAAFPLDPDRVKVAQPVFHVPQRSRFVFLNELKRIKGSDASNIHDEEPGDHELEFSDDEEEAAFKRSQKLKRKRPDSRAPSVASSRQSTPTPSQMRDQDMGADPYGGYPYNPYDSHDMDAGAGPSRSAPLPYDDPYADAYGTTAIEEPLSPSEPPPPSPSITSGPHSPSRASHGPREAGRNDGYHAERGGSRGRGRGRGQNRDNRGRAGGRGRGRGRGDWQRGSRHEDQGPRQGGGPRGSWNGQDQPQRGYSQHEEYDPRGPRPLSPTSEAIARATGQYGDGSNYQQQQPPQSQQGMGYGPPQNGWGYQASHQPSFDYPQGYVQPHINPHIQPHINPRFAASFGMNMGYNAAGAAYHGGGASFTPQPWTDASNYQVKQEEDY